MNLQHLSYIVEIANSGSISKAAHKLFVSQPYLSKILQEVENEYNIAIFSRSKSGILPTDNGQLFIDMAKELLEDANLFQKMFYKQTDIHHLRVASSQISHSIDAFVRMLDEFPDDHLRFSYYEGGVLDVINAIDSNNADIGILLMPSDSLDAKLRLLQSHHILFHELFRTGFCLVVRNGHPLLSKTEPLTMEDLYQYNFVLYPRVRHSKAQVSENAYNDAIFDFIDWSRIQQIVYIYNRSSLHNILTRTDYIGLGTSAAPEQNKNFQIASLPFPSDISAQGIQHDSYILGYIHSKNHVLSPTAQKYISFIKNCYGDSSQ